jgi:hypothetical protein
VRIKRLVIAATTTVLVAGSACLAVLAQSGSAGATATTGLPVTDVFQMVADTAHGHVTIKVGVKITAAQSGYYKSTKVSGTEYRVYHHTATLKDAVTVAPDHGGECVKLQVQDYSHGTWRADKTTTSHGALRLKLGATGRFRVRADFVRSAKDIANVNTDGSWLYYEVTK